MREGSAAPVVERRGAAVVLQVPGLSVATYRAMRRRRGARMQVRRPMFTADGSEAPAPEAVILPVSSLPNSAAGMQKCSS